jgi:hypothetical protein
MNRLPKNPRSTLHAMTPYSQGTSEVESLLSYFCRLAMSHSVSTLILSRTIARHMHHEISPDYDWHERKIAGSGDSALTWSAALSALTSVDGLDSLTFLPWRDVISQNGLSLVTRGQFCPACFGEDVASSRSPYFRLAWESAEVTVCAKHGNPLCQHCPYCKKDNIRHAAAFVVPGWCTHCGEFLGTPAECSTPTVIDPAALWRARQVGELLGLQSTLTAVPSRTGLLSAITQLIAEMDNGQSAAFARRIGVAKSTIHHWLKSDGTPTLSVSLKMSAHCGLSLVQLLTGNLAAWRPPTPERQQVLRLPQPPMTPRPAPRKLDWGDIEMQLHAFLALPTPISVLEAARRLGVEARQLYLRVNRTTRQLGQRWRAYLQRRHQDAVVRAWPYLETACWDIWSEGKAVTRRDIAARVPPEILSPVAHLLDVLKEVQAHLQNSGPVEEVMSSD